MILFDLIVASHAPEFPKDIASYSSCLLSSSISFRPMLKSIVPAYIVKTPQVLTQPKQKLANKSFVKQNLWQKLVDTIWAQTVFLSPSSRMSDKYFVELNYLNIHDDQSTGKNLMIKFSQSLFTGSIHASFSDSALTHCFPLSVQYTWPKSFRLKQKKFLSLFRKDSYKQYLAQIKNYASYDNALNHLPLFTVSNNLGQMIISEPPGNLDEKKDLLDYVLPNVNSRPLHQGWFFTNFEDAHEYMESINSYYGLQEGHLKIFTCNFSAFCKIADSFSQRVYFRLVPNLQEVGKLVNIYRHYGGISFHKKQNYSATYFQGQPIYIPKTNNKYVYSDPSTGQEIGRYNLVFTSYETACDVMNKLTNDSSSRKCPNASDFLVYNLESFIKNQLYSHQDKAHSFLIVPSKDSYQFTKKHFMKSKTALITGAITTRVSSMRLWSARVLWSLTSRHPKDW